MGRRRHPDLLRVEGGRRSSLQVAAGRNRHPPREEGRSARSHLPRVPARNPRARPVPPGRGRCPHRGNHCPAEALTGVVSVPRDPIYEATAGFVMPKVQIYSTDWCPYCSAAKSLLEDKGVPYEEIDVTEPTLRMAMVERAHGRRTVPQIFIGDLHVGGYDDLSRLERRGELDPLLA